MDKNLLLEIQKIKNLYQYNYEVLNEQVQTPTYDDYAKEFIKYTKGVGTNPNGIVKLIQKFQTASQFNEFLKALENRGKNFEYVINDEFEHNNLNDAYKIVNHLVNIGVPASYNVSYMGGKQGFAKNSFKLNASLTSATQQQQPVPAKDGSKTTPSKTKQQVFKEKFPLLFQMKGQNILKLQQALGVKATGYFYKLTEAAVAKKMKEMGKTYNRKIGIDATTYNQIVSDKQQSNTSTPTFTGDFTSKENVQKRADIAAKATERAKQLGIES